MNKEGVKIVTIGGGQQLYTRINGRVHQEI